jgi:thiol:disulfide interchange protein DsbC
MAIGSAALLQPFTGQANELQSAVERLTPENLQDQIETVTELPITGVFAAQAQGEIYFISSDGRFVFSGRAHDLWYDQPLNTMANIDASATILDLTRMGVDSAELNTLQVGAGPITHTVFIDPLCESCIDYIEQSADLVDDGHAFNFVLVPALGEPSVELAGHFACREGVSEEEAFAAVVERRIGDLPRQEECDLSPYLSSITLAEMIKVDGVPFTTTQDGHVFRGLPENLVDHLEGRE